MTRQLTLDTGVKVTLPDGDVDDFTSVEVDADGETYETIFGALVAQTNGDVLYLLAGEEIPEVELEDEDEEEAVVAHLQGKHDQATHGKGGVLSEKQYAVLDPKRKRDLAAVKKTFDETPEGKRVFEAITSFTSRRGGVSKVRDDIEKMSRGEDVPEVSRQRIDDFTSAMNNYPGVTPKLHRGMAIETTTDEAFNSVLDAYEPGKSFDLNVTSFSSSERQALNFGNNSKLKSGEFIRIKLVMDDAKALPVENASKYRYEKEWLTGGKFRVKSRADPTPRKQYYEVHIEQTDTL